MIETDTKTGGSKGYTDDNNVDKQTEIAENAGWNSDQLLFLFFFFVFLFSLPFTGVDDKDSNSVSEGHFSNTSSRP